MTMDLNAAKVIRNIIGLSAIVYMLGLPLGRISRNIRRNFQKKNQKL